MTPTTRADTRRHQQQRRRRRRSRAVDVLRGLAALAAILTVVVGAPALLSVVAPIGLPTTAPTWEQVTAVLMRPDDGTLFLALLTLAAWGGWAVFTISVLLEAVAQARALPTPRLPGAGWSQRLAASLVTTAGLLLTSTAPLLAAAPAAHATVATAPAATTPAQAMAPVATAAPAPAPSAHAAAAPSEATVAVDRHPVVVVERGDSLWRLAERHLGDGERFTEIVALNHSRPQPDGRALNDTNWIHPGWSLRLPADATDLPTPTPAAPPAAAASAADGEQATTTEAVVHEVARGDTLWGISAQHLGNGARYREIYDLNAGTPQDDGRTLTDPDLIRPGWDLTIPTTASTDLDGSTGPSDSAAAATPEAVGPAEEPQGLEEAAPLTGDPAPGGVADSDDVRTGADESWPGADLEAVEAAPVAQSFFVGLTAIGAATVIGMLARLRARQQKDRRVGQRILMPQPGAPAAATERQLRRAGPALSVEDLTLALTALVPAARAAGRDVPAVALVRVSDERLEVHLAEPDADALAPFTTIGPRVWAAPLTALTGLQDDPSHYWPYPALVSVGVDADGAVVLVNLEAAGTLVITGEPDTTAAVLRAMACELATARPLDVTCIWVDPCLAELRDASYVALAERGGDLDALAERAHAELVHLRENGLADGLHARFDPEYHEACYPDVWVLTDPAPALPPWSGEVILTTGHPAPDGAWVLDVQPDGAAILHPAGLPLHAPRLSEAGYRDILDLLVQGFADNTSPEPGASTTAPPVPQARAVTSLAEDTVEALAALPHPTNPTPLDDDAPGPENGDTAADAAEDAGQPGASGEARPRVLLLGPVQITTGHDAGADGRSRRTLELLAYLALHPEGVSAAELDEIIGHGNRVPATTRNTAISRARTWLGKDPAGQPYLLPFQPGTGYRLSPAVCTDWDDFLHHARHGLAAGPNGVDHLTTALGLVRGRPFTGAAPGTYDWAEAVTQEMISTITDIAHAAARTHLHAGNPTAAAAAAAVGLTVDPCNEQLYRDAIAAAGARGDTEEIHRLANNLCAHLTAIDPLERPDEETYDLVHRYVATGNDVVGYRRRDGAPTPSKAT